MTIQEIFASDVTRDIPPVIYFHEQDPEKLRSEVEEYIITGGFEEGDPRRKRISDGIHEQYVRLLTSLGRELEKAGGADLPACWISGFYGSGKSSFAKLLGLSLDQRQLPSGQSLADALLARDDSPRQAEFHEAWHGVVDRIDPIAVVFDIGAIARDDEHIHSAVKRQLAERLGYCPGSHYVADFELKLEQDGKWEEFLQLAEKTLGKPWSVAKDEQLAEDHFSEVMHGMRPTLYEEPMAWLDVRTGSGVGATSVDETVRDIDAMLKFRAPGKTLFLVIDEVSQYIHQNDGRMLKLQSFVEALGQRLRGQVWLMATGQQKLEEDLEGSNLSKLKDRFPPRLRAHLAPTNIRDVVHKRLLRKHPAQETALAALFEEKRSDLRLYGYKCAEITAHDFVEVYPMLPGHVDLLMLITSNLRARSTRMKGDDHAIRGLLQLLGELFREQKLGEKPFGSLVTLDQIYDVQHTALDADVQNTMARLMAHEELSCDEVALRAAKAVALLELIQEHEPTTPELVAQCLYSKVGAGSLVDAYRDALLRLYEGGFLASSDKHGYKIQSSAGQEWSRERDSHSVTSSAISAIVHEKLRELLGQASRPLFKNRSFPLAAFYSDSRGAKEEKLQSPTDPAVVTFDFQFLTNQDDRGEEQWLRESDLTANQERVLWVSGAPGALDSKIRELVRSQHMVKRYEPRLQSLPEGRKRLLFDEQNREASLERDVLSFVAEVFLSGALYFRARQLDKSRHGNSFPALIKGVGEEVLPLMYQHFIEVAVTDKELKDLLEVDLSGVNHKFLEKGLGLLTLDAGKYIPKCEGEVVSRIRQLVEERNGLPGSQLLSHFGGPPCGYPSDVVKACVLGLLRGGQVRLRPAAGPMVTSVRDPGVRDLFQGDKEFKKADILPGEVVITMRHQVACRKFFNSSLDADFELDNDHIADAVFAHFPQQRQRLEQLHHRLASLRERPALPTSLDKLPSVLENCMRSRHVEETVLELLKHMDTLRDGLQELGLYLADMTEESMAQVKTAQRVLATEFEQLKLLGVEDAMAAEAQEVAAHLRLPKPWREIGQLSKSVEALQSCYRETRRGLLDRHESLAEEMSAKIKQREGFANLNEEQANSVLRFFREALLQTDSSAVSPNLTYLRDSVPVRLKDASVDANRALDALLAQVVKVHVVEFRTGLGGRELKTERDIDSMLGELRERLMAQLKDDVRIRLV